MGVLNDLLHVVSFWYVKKKLILYVLENSYAGTSGVGFNLGAGWVKVEFTPGRMVFSESQNKDGNESVGFVQKFTGNLAGNNFIFPADIKGMTDEPVICKIDLANGLSLIIGNGIVPVNMSYEKRTENNELVISFERTSEEMAFVWDSDIYLPPPIPVAVAVTGITTGGFTVGWNKTETAVGYYLDVSESSSFANFVTGYQEKDVGDLSSFAVTGLAANTTYYYRVRAYNEHTYSNYSNVVSGTTEAAEISLPEIETLVVSDYSYGTPSCNVIFRFNIVSVGSLDIGDTFWGISWGTTASADSFESVETTYTTPGENTIYVTENVPPDTLIYYKAKATNIDGTVYGEVLSFTTLAE